LEANDSRDNLDVEIRKKIALGYPIAGCIIEGMLTPATDRNRLGVSLRSGLNSHRR
jgi:hypothetical protein